MKDEMAQPWNYGKRWNADPVVTTHRIRRSHTVSASGSPASAQGASEAFPEPAGRLGVKKPSAPEQ